MKLYGLPGSPNTRKVLATISHLGLNVAVEQLSFARGDLTSPAFQALNPNAMVPVLVDGTLTLSESAAIMTYLVDKAGASSLFPQEPTTRADVLRWLFWEQAHFNRAFGTLIFESVIKPRYGMGEPSEGLVAYCLRELARFAPVLDSHLKSRAVLVGDDLTLADYAMVSLEAYRDKTVFDWAPFRNIDRYFKTVREQPAWRDSFVAPPAPPAQFAAPRTGAPKDVVAA